MKKHKETHFEPKQSLEQMHNNKADGAFDHLQKAYMAQAKRVL